MKGKSTMRTRSQFSFGLALATVVAFSTVTYAWAWQRTPNRTRVPQRLEAHEFVLTAADGKELAALHATEGHPQFTLYDENHSPRVVLSVLQGGAAAVMVGDPTGKNGPRASLMILPSGGVALSLQGNGQITMAVPEERSPNLEMSNRDRQVIFQAVRTSR